jgi:MoaA/NifB/PqqE/SkfB family radical SAM enzyme
MRSWLVPYVKSRILPGDFHPLIACLFTEWKCNLECHYCWTSHDRAPGMTEDIARRSVDWLRGTTCRVLALMGGEPLLRPHFVHKVVDYAAQRGFWICIPTNGRLLRPDTIDRLGDAGVALINLGLDAVHERPGLPKALAPIRPHFEYLARKQYFYGYTVLLGINICRNNLEDVRELSRIAHDHGLAVDYHINETPLTAQPHFRRLDDNPTFIRPEDFPRVHALIDWIIARHRAGCRMVNSIARLNDMKAFLRGTSEPWNCRAGQNLFVIRVDGTLAPCYPLCSATHDWGTIGNPRFSPAQLGRMKKSCQPHCFSTLNHNLGFCYDDTRVLRWLFKQARRGFQGVSGSFE